MTMFRKILCPVDFSEPAAAARDKAVELAKSGGGEIRLIHVVEPILVPADFAFGPVTPIELEEQFVKQSEEKLKAIGEAVKAAGVKVDLILKRGKPFDEIVRAGKEWGADLVVIGTHGLTGLSHILMGSTAEKVVRKSPCAVLVVKSGPKP